jgi:hypothetical protein
MAYVTCNFDNGLVATSRFLNICIKSVLIMKDIAL